MFRAMERGELRALYVVGENPAKSEVRSENAPLREKFDAAWGVKVPPPHRHVPRHGAGRIAGLVRGGRKSREERGPIGERAAAREVRRGVGREGSTPSPACSAPWSGENCGPCTCWEKIPRRAR